MKKQIELTEEQLKEYVVLKELFEELLEDVPDEINYTINNIIDNYGTIEDYLIKEYETPFYSDEKPPFDTPKFDTAENIFVLANQLDKEQVKELLLHLSIMNKLPKHVIS